MALVLLRPEVSCSKRKVAAGVCPRCPFPEVSCSKRKVAAGVRVCPRCPFPEVSCSKVAGVDFGRGGVGECGKGRVGGSCGMPSQEFGGNSCGKMLVARRSLVDVGCKKE